jgi:hypothetical protein
MTFVSFDLHYHFISSISFLFYFSESFVSTNTGTFGSKSAHFCLKLSLFAGSKPIKPHIVARSIGVVLNLRLRDLRRLDFSFNMNEELTVQVC